MALSSDWPRRDGALHNHMLGLFNRREPLLWELLVKKGYLGRGFDSCTKSGSGLDVLAGHLLSLGPHFALPLIFLQRGKQAFKSLYSGAEDNTEGLNNYVFPFSRLSTTQQQPNSIQV